MNYFKFSKFQIYVSLSAISSHTHLKQSKATLKKPSNNKTLKNIYWLYTCSFCRVRRVGFFFLLYLLVIFAGSYRCWLYIVVVTWNIRYFVSIFIWGKVKFYSDLFNISVLLDFCRLNEFFYLFSSIFRNSLRLGGIDDGIGIGWVLLEWNLYRTGSICTLASQESH